MAVVICDVTTVRPPDGSIITRSTERRGTDVTALVGTLLLPDLPLTLEQCGTYRMLLPWFVLVDRDGRWVKPRYPQSGRCAHPRQEVLTTLQRLPTKTVATTTLAVQTTAAAAEAGCTQNVKEPIFFGARHDARSVPGTAPTITDPFDGALPLRVCIYDNPPQPAGINDPNFAAGGTLTAAQQQSLAQLLAASTAAPPAGCTTPAARIAVITPTTGNSAAYVELDGCKRILFSPAASRASLAQASGLLATWLKEFVNAG